MGKRRLKYKILLPVGPPLVSAILKLYKLAVRIEYRNLDSLVERARQAKPSIVAFWHHDFLIGTLIGYHVAAKGVPVAVLASLSDDGELLARTAHRFGMAAVRGSSSRGARSGLRAMEEHLRGGGCAAIAVDGPRGPRHVAKPGAVLMARDTGAVIFPAAVRYARRWRLKSWDRTLIPKPFSRCTVTFFDPLSVAPDAARKGLENARKELERVLLENGEPDPE